MNSSREGFEAWAASEGIDCSTIEDGWHFQQLMTETLWEGWSARDSEVERLRGALKEAEEYITARVVNTGGRGETWLLPRLRSALSSQVKESGK